MLGFIEADAQLNLDFELLGSGLALTANEAQSDGVKQVEKVKIYLSNFKLYQDEVLIYQEEDSYHLLDFSDGSGRIKLKGINASEEYNYLSFDLGIDSLTNAGGARGGALDPSRGMYWAWQSGYINFKIEGASEDSPSRKNKFQFHVGGFLDGDDCVQNIKLSLVRKEEHKILIDLDQFFEGVDLSQEYELMSPGKGARSLAVLLANCFSLAP